MDVHLLSSGWSPTIPRIVTHHPKYGTNLPKDGHQFSKDWSPSITKMVKHNFSQDSHPPFQDGQLDLEFDSSAAQLVTVVFVYLYENIFIQGGGDIKSSCLEYHPLQPLNLKLSIAIHQSLLKMK